MTQEEKLISESEVLRILGIKKLVLSSMRNSLGLTFVRVSKTTRFYLFSDILNWAKEHRMTINPES
jgi:hypothetical protein